MYYHTTQGNLEKVLENTTLSKKVLVTTVIGAPNAGKSSLINYFVGRKVTIVSPKAHSTWKRVQGITNLGSVQLIFVDTPGVCWGAVRSKLLKTTALLPSWKEISDSDEILLLVDAKIGVSKAVIAILNFLKSNSLHVILVLNKIDLVQHESLLKLTKDLNTYQAFTNTFMISAKTGSGATDLLDLLTKKAKIGAWLFPETEISDMPLHLFAAEITREKIFSHLHDELPYSTIVLTNSWSEHTNGSLYIYQTVVVLRESQRAIVLGKSGSCIRSLSIRARQELEKILMRRVHLFLDVKVDRG